MRTNEKILHCVEFKLWLNTGEYLKKNLICTRKYMCMQNIGDDTYPFTCDGTGNGWSCINEGFLNEIWYFLLWGLFIFNYISKLLFVTYIAGTFKALFLILGWLKMKLDIFGYFIWMKVHHHDHIQWGLLDD